MACPFCALGLHHFAPSEKVEQQFRQRARLVHPDKRLPEFKEQAADEFKLLDATRDLALRYTATGVMPFICPSPAIPDPVPIGAATRLPAYMPFGAATRWPAPQPSERADQETNPEDSHKVWSKRSWRWIGKCKSCAATDFSVWAHGAAPPRLVGWSKYHNLCPTCNQW
jgi:hypothetical protein